jgi:hypothetical protein
MIKAHHSDHSDVGDGRKGLAEGQEQPSRETFLFTTASDRRAMTEAIADTTLLPATLSRLIQCFAHAGEMLFSTSGAFAAKLDDGRVVTWGAAGYGGDSSAVQAPL